MAARHEGTRHDVLAKRDVLSKDVLSKEAHTKHEILAEIRTLRTRLPHLTGVLVATIDGLLVAHDTRGVEPDTVAAMSAAQLGLGQQIAQSVAQGGFLETVTRTSRGYVAVFTAGPHALLTVIAGAELNLGRLHHEARPVAERLGLLVAPR